MDPFELGFMIGLAVGVGVVFIGQGFIRDYPSEQKPTVGRPNPNFLRDALDEAQDIIDKGIRGEQ